MSPARARATRCAPRAASAQPFVCTPIRGEPQASRAARTNPSSRGSIAGSPPTNVTASPAERADARRRSISSAPTAPRSRPFWAQKTQAPSQARPSETALRRAIAHQRILRDSRPQAQAGVSSHDGDDEPPSRATRWPAFARPRRGALHRRMRQRRIPIRRRETTEAWSPRGRRNDRRSERRALVRRTEDQVRNDVHHHEHGSEELRQVRRPSAARARSATTERARTRVRLPRRFAAPRPRLAQSTPRRTRGRAKARAGRTTPAGRAIRSGGE